MLYSFTPCVGHRQFKLNHAADKGCVDITVVDVMSGLSVNSSHLGKGLWDVWPCCRAASRLFNDLECGVGDVWVIQSYQWKDPKLFGSFLDSRFDPNPFPLHFGPLDLVLQKITCTVEETNPSWHCTIYTEVAAFGPWSDERIIRAKDAIKGKSARSQKCNCLDPGPS